MSTIRSIPTRFADFALGASIQRAIVAAGFLEPRPIQLQTIPAALAGRDVLGLAQTGTGKTAAFALPLLERLLPRLSTRARGPRVLIVAPTRELATQIGEEIDRLARYTRVKTAVVFGGVSARPQIAALRERPAIVVACPGRLLDLLAQGELALGDVETLVLDEADHMFDMGFLPDVRRILAALPAERQNLLFAATMPPEIRGLAQQLLRDPLVVELSHSKPVDTIDHALYPVDSERKLEALQAILAEDGFVSAIVFTRTKHRARRLARQLDAAGHRAVALQGNMSQNARERAMTGFRQRRFDVLVATDIAARGIDVEQVSHVVNFDMPGTPDAYTHRIGRTGRAERDGRAYTFVTTDDRAMVEQVERRIGQRIPRRSFDGARCLAAEPVRSAPAVSRGGRAARAPRSSSRGRRR
ncbi:MAG TPA: DEAD/DEAH box helicase [Candidatus Polarisedimenticolaceae bacterium]|nr:DEAD/DEAH box helicase [Candidatus Polarisedimenticolaceae bacterium]